MPNTTERMKAMIFDYATTNKTDYKAYDIKAPVVTSFTPRRKKPREKYKPVKDVHTMTPWQSEVPFYLLHRPKAIVQTNPRKIQQRFEKPKDTGREEAQKTRPRLVMTPAVSMDDIKDNEARAILCEDMYTTDVMAGLREAVRPYFRVESPFPGMPAPSNPVVLPKYTPQVVPKEWRMDSVTWDNRQLRGYCDADKEFWLSRPTPKCRACDESVAMQNYRKAKHLAMRQQ